MKAKTVLVTRPRHQADPFARALEQAGLKPILFPTIEIRCLDDWTLPEPDRFAGTFFTSVNAAHCFCDRLRSEAPERLAALSQARVWAVGRATAEALAGYDVGTEPLPKLADAVHLMASIEPSQIAGQDFLFVRGTLSLGTVPAVIAERGGRCTTLTVYANSQPSQAEADRIRSLLQAGALDCLSFTSPSTALNFFDALDGATLPRGVLVAAIGTTTAAVLEQLGVRVDIVPAAFDASSLASAIAARLSGLSR